MPAIHAVELRERLQNDLPKALAPLQPGTTTPDFLTTNDTVINAEYLISVVTYLRDTLGYTFLSDIAVVDYLTEGIFELVYRFYHLDGGGDLVLKVRIPRAYPDIPSLTPIWPGANFHEREAFDLFGINFTGEHPDLRRIYMWDEFEGYPMRKDFPKQGDHYFGED